MAFRRDDASRRKRAGAGVGRKAVRLHKTLTQHEAIRQRVLNVLSACTDLAGARWDGGGGRVSTRGEIRPAPATRYHDSRRCTVETALAPSPTTSRPTDAKSTLERTLARAGPHS